MKYIKLVGYAVFCMVMFKACQYDAACQIVESIPTSCFQKILEDHPEKLESTLELAEFWTEKGDSIANDVRIIADVQNHWEEMTWE